jgi:hypothetical protein
VKAAVVADRTRTLSSHPAPAPQGESRTLGRDLERRRLEVRAHRLELVLRALRDRGDEATGERVPPGLEAAIHEFRTELGRVNARRGELL